MSVAHALLCPANALAATLLPATVQEPPADNDVLPIEEVVMPADDVSDLKDVFDAINRLCETMRTSTYDDVAEDLPDMDYVDEATEIVSSDAISIVEATNTTVKDEDTVQVVESESELISPSEVSIRNVEAYRAERWSDALVSPPTDALVSPPTDETDTFPSDTETANAACEIYYTASSEVSLLSDMELPERPTIDNDVVLEKDKEESKECVIAGHVAAMRERFESMTRANTPGPEPQRPGSPGLDLRNITPSPDMLG